MNAYTDGQLTEHAIERPHEILPCNLVRADVELLLERRQRGRLHARERKGLLCRGAALGGRERVGRKRIERCEEDTLHQLPRAFAESRVGLCLEEMANGHLHRARECKLHHGRVLSGGLRLGLRAAVQRDSKREAVRAPTRVLVLHHRMQYHRSQQWAVLERAPRASSDWIRQIFRECETQRAPPRRVARRRWPRAPPSMALALVRCGRRESPAGDCPRRARASAVPLHTEKKETVSRATRAAPSSPARRATDCRAAPRRADP